MEKTLHIEVSIVEEKFDNKPSFMGYSNNIYDKTCISSNYGSVIKDYEEIKEVILYRYKEFLRKQKNVGKKNRTGEIEFHFYINNLGDYRNPQTCTRFSLYAGRDATIQRGFTIDFDNKNHGQTEYTKYKDNHKHIDILLNNAKDFLVRNIQKAVNWVHDTKED